MPQKEKTFQSKSKKFSGGSRGGDRPAGRGFRKKFEGDREDRDFRGGEKRPQRRFDRDDRPARQDREERFEKRSTGKFEKRSSNWGDSPRREKFSEDRPRRFERDDRAPRREKSFGDKPRRDREEGSFERKRPYNRDDAAPRARRFDRDDNRAPRREKSFGDKPRRDREEGGRGNKFGEDRKQDRYEQKPYKRYDDRKPGGKKFGDKKFGDKKFGDKKFGDKKFGDKKFGSKRYEDKPFEEKRSRVPASPETREKLKSDRASYGAPSSAFLYGVHPVTEALKNPKRLHQRLLCTEKGFAAIEAAYQEAAGSGLKLPQITYVEKEDIDRLLPRDAVHQDILLDSQPLEEVFISDVLVNAPENGVVLVLDQVTDPHNVGAILRSASAFGVFAVVAQKLHAPEITGTLAKSASGAVEHVPLVREVNLSRALEQLKEAGFFCIGLDERGKRTLADAMPKGKVALVLGAEGDGLRRLVAENCDTLAKLPTQGNIASLNVSNAAAVALYERMRLG